MKARTRTATMKTIPVWAVATALVIISLLVILPH
jgi:hypothetical protein